MKPLFLTISLLLCNILLPGIMASAQVQQGYVKTKGRMVDGKLVPGQGLKGATISIKGRTPILVNSDDGSFSFPTSDRQFHLDSVRKKGYQLVDMDACPKTYVCSSSPIYIVMETPEQMIEDKINAEKKIRRNLQKQLEKKEEELELLKEEERITTEEYQQTLQKLYSEQESNERIISDMARRYAELDYDLLDEFYRQVSYCIENGELTKADSLLRSRGNISKQVNDMQLRGHNLREQKELLEKVRAVQRADTEDAARHCKSLADKFHSQQQYDSAAYYLELRALLDTTNIEWQYTPGEYIHIHTADYDKALPYFQRALRQSKQQGQYNEWTAKTLFALGRLYKDKDDHQTAMEKFNEALTICNKILDENHPLRKAIITSINSSTNQQSND